MPRKLLPVDPLVKSGQLKLRNYFKHENNLARNASEKKLIQHFGYNDTREMYHTMATDYNAFVERENDTLEENRK